MVGQITLRKTHILTVKNCQDAGVDKRCDIYFFIRFHTLHHVQSFVRKKMNIFLQHVTVEIGL